MPLSYPSFPKFEFQSIDTNSLYAVDFIVELERLEKQLSDHDKNYEQTRIIPPTADEDVRALVERHFPRPAESGSTPDTQARLRELIEKAKPLAFEFNKFSPKLARIVEAFREEYLRFDWQRFDADYGAIEQPVSPKVYEAQDEHDEYLRKRNGIQARLEKHKANLPKCFKDGELPVRFRENLLTEPTPPARRDDTAVMIALMDRHDKAVKRFEEARQTMALCVAREFVKAWRERAPMFARPVTVLGTLIASLDEPKQKLWLDAYEKLGLGFIPKQVQYVEVGTAPKPKLIISKDQFMQSGVSL
jgi:hypothetical protein